MKLMYEKVREIDGNFVVPLSPGNCVTLAPPYLQYFNAWASFSSHRSDGSISQKARWKGRWFKTGMGFDTFVVQ